MLWPAKDGTPTGRRGLGFVLVAAGIATILAGVLYVLKAANGPGLGSTTFATRRGYDQVKVAVHDSFPIGLAIALAGLGSVVLGNWLLTRPRGHDDPSDTASDPD